MGSRSLFIVWVGLLACGGADPTPGTDAAVPDSAIPDSAVPTPRAPDVVGVGEVVRAEIGPLGGTLELSHAGRRWVLEVPPTSLAETHEITMQAGESDALPSVALVLLEPTGLSFRNGATLRYDGLDEASPAISFEPGEPGVELTVASADDTGVRFVVEHFSAGGVGPIPAGVLDPAEADRLAELARLEAMDRQAVALAEEGRRLVAPSLVGARAELARSDAAMATYRSWSSRVGRSRLELACDQVPCVPTGVSCSDTCATGTCRDGRCVRTLGLLAREVLDLLVAELNALLVAITSPACQDLGPDVRSRPEYWVLAPDQVDIQLSELGAPPPLLPRCVETSLEIRGPSALGDAREVTLTFEPTITTPTGPPPLGGTLAVTATGATPNLPFGGARFDGSSADVRFDRGEEPAPTLRVQARATFDPPFQNLPAAEADALFTRSEMRLVLDATETRVREGGGRVDICGTLIADEMLVAAWNIVSARVEGLGTIDDTSMGTTDGSEVCGLFFVAPSPLPMAATTTRVFVNARAADGQEAEASIELQLDPGDLRVSVEATPDVLFEDDATSRICVRALDGAAPPSRFEVRLEQLSGPGALEDTDLLSVGVPVVCGTYRGPGTAPTIGQDVRIRATVTAGGITRSAEVELRVDANALDVTLNAPASVAPTGSVRACADARRGAVAAVDFPVVFNATGGTLDATTVRTDASGRACVMATPAAGASAIALEATADDGVVVASDDATVLVRNRATWAGTLIVERHLTEEASSCRTQQMGGALTRVEIDFFCEDVDLSTGGACRIEREVGSHLYVGDTVRPSVSTSIASGSGRFCDECLPSEVCSSIGDACVGRFDACVSCRRTASTSTTSLRIEGAHGPSSRSFDGISIAVRDGVTTLALAGQMQWETQRTRTDSATCPMFDGPDCSGVDMSCPTATTTVTTEAAGVFPSDFEDPIVLRGGDGSLDGVYTDGYVLRGMTRLDTYDFFAVASLVEVL